LLSIHNRYLFYSFDWKISLSFVDNRTELDDLKTRVDLAELVRRSGVELKPVGLNLLGRCPFHDDSTASLSVNEQEQLFNCFGCEAGGDALSFIQLKEKVEFPKAVERLKEWALQVPLAPKSNGKKVAGPQDPLPGNLSRNDLLGRVAERYCLRFRECPEGQRYLSSRGLESRELWEAFRVGYVDGSLLESLPKNGATRDALVQLGVLNSKGREHFLGCVVVPLEHPDQGLLGFYGRKVDPTDPVPHLYLPGPKRGGAALAGAQAGQASLCSRERPRRPLAMDGRRSRRHLSLRSRHDAG
jgi:DNA primase